MTYKTLCLIVRQLQFRDIHHRIRSKLPYRPSH